VTLSAGSGEEVTIGTDELAIEGGRPVRPHPLPQGLAVGDELRARIAQLLDKGELSRWYNGPCARRFEERFAAYHGSDLFALGVNSGTSALHLALEAAGVGPGDEVILPALCFVAAATAVVQLGAVPIVCDVASDNLMLDPAVAETLIGARTAAILPVHFWGYPADLPSLRALCDAHDLALVEDAAQAPGATVAGVRTGTYGDFSTFSFANRKHVTCGEGGMVLMRSQERLESMRALANCGKGEGWDDYRTHGYSYRMTELTGVVGLHGLERLDREIASRRGAADQYREVLDGSGLLPVPAAPGAEAVYFKLPVLLPHEHVAEREFVVEAVMAENVSCRVPHRPLYAIPWLAEYLQRAGRFRGAAECPVADSLHRRLIEVETGPNLPPEEARKSALAVEKVWRRIVGS
jgi:perosamine synthetase